MKKSLKQNWLKLGIMILIIIIIFSFAYSLGQKNRVRLGKKIDFVQKEPLENQDATKKDYPGDENVNQKELAESNDLNKILSKDLKVVYSGSLADKPTDIPETIGLNFELPKDYEIAISKKYSSKENGDFKVLGLRQIKSDTLRDYYPAEIDGKDAYMPVKPVMVVIVDSDNIIRHLVILSDYPFFQGNKTFDDYNIKSLNNSIEFKDFNADETQEILVYTFKPYTADSLTSLSVISLNKNDEQGAFFKTQRFFKTTYKENSRLIERKGAWFIAEAESGVGDCRTCPTVYMINIYGFSNYQHSEIENNFIKLATVVSEKEFESGDDVLNYKMSEINKKIDNLDELE